ncbi:class I SAM-dependent methyltransferase [Roseateles sp.]|uniref:class I SAM-dependent methyltransferase n=1 Tax=Roseateles sp. TaxID=1971397 RepID=UPI003BA5D2F8
MFTDLIPDAAPPVSKTDASVRFLRLLETALANGTFSRLLLSKYVGTEAQLERLTLREVSLRGERHLSFLWRYQTRDITKNFPLDEALQQISGLLGAQFHSAHLQTQQGEEVQLVFSRKGRPSLRMGKVAPAVQPAATDAGHDKEKHRYLELSRPFWLDLGVTHQVRSAGEERPQLVPAMSRKWKQINKFIEIFAAAMKSSGLVDSPDVHVADFGSGKGYLTFAMHDWLRSQGKDAQVTGVELRDDMVKLCGAAAAKHQMTGLRFDQGDVRSYTPLRLDVMIALHACDIATDYAIHFGLRAGAKVIMCSPCCHKQLRPQMQTPTLLRPLLQHGIHLGQEAEMVTDGLRALLLEAEGYDTQVFEFVALEHTSKNKMILAVKRSQPVSAARRAELLAQIDEIKRFYGIQEQALQALLAA